MKKIIFGILASALITNLSYGQATLEHSYASGIIQFENKNVFLTTSGLNYYTLDETINELKIYNETHSLIKTIQFPVTSGYSFKNLLLISDKLFNADNLIEFIVVGYNQSTSTYKSTLINENGVILQEFGNRAEAYVIKGLTGNSKLVTILSGFYTGTKYYDIYSLPGSLLNVLQNKLANKSLIGYPNPAANKIAFTNPLKSGEKDVLEVFDINGKKVLQENVSGESKEINLDVTNLTRGIYIYKINGETNKFIKE
jgi:hypothetical protein